MEKEKLENLRELVRKRRGSVKQIMQLHGCSREWVRLVLRGTWEDYDLLKIAARVVAKKESSKTASIKSVERVLAEVA